MSERNWWAALILAIAFIMAVLGGARAGQGYGDGVPCHDFDGKEYKRCAAAVVSCERQFGIKPNSRFTENSRITEEVATKMDRCIGTRFDSDKAWFVAERGIDWRYCFVWGAADQRIITVSGSGDDANVYIRPEAFASLRKAMKKLEKSKACREMQKKDGE
jgi:hypothetical protein